jgi:hypothetical protein
MDLIRSYADSDDDERPQKRMKMDRVETIQVDDQLLSTMRDAPPPLLFDTISSNEKDEYDSAWASYIYLTSTLISQISNT